MQDDVENAFNTLTKGGIILYPTDTIWGIGCDATCSEAVKKVYELKKRIETKSMLVLVDGVDMLRKYVSDVPQQALELIEQSALPLTIIYPTAKNLSSNLIAKDGSVGIRITNEIFSNEICKKLKKPIVSTSANISEMAAPLFFDEISDEIKTHVDYIVNYRQDDKSSVHPSKIVKINTEGEIIIIRE